MMSQSSVLLVEPDDDTRQMYAEYLRSRGLAIVIAETTDDGLAQAAGADIVVTGIRVPGSFDGIELVRRLRDSALTTRAPIIVLTACAFEPERQRALTAGCDCFLRKPCLPDRLEGEIRHLLALRRLPKATPVKANLSTTRRTSGSS